MGVNHTAFCDFAVKYDPQKDTKGDLTRKILQSVILGRLKYKKPAVIFVGGMSGEGKSLSCISLQLMLLQLQGVDTQGFMEFMNVMNVFTPLEYPEKMQKILYDKRYKKCNIVTVHEARNLVKAKLWQGFLAQAVSDINAMSRSVKRLCVFIVSQFIRDITMDVRYTLNYYMVVRRPKRKPARVYIYVTWFDDRDMEKPKLRKRKLSGYLVLPNGRYQRYIPQYLELSMPPKDIVAEFDKQDTEAKSSIIKGKLEQMIQEMRLEIGEETKKISAMVDYYTRNPDNLSIIGKRYRGAWKLTPQAKEMHALSDDECKRFETQLNMRFKEKGMLNDYDNDESMQTQEGM